ncbi:MAG TPA: hypothetical protein VM846_00570 [Vicinamibacterales bacterium]|jgi:hypothetical protein|nr:hypothetical protein [Vicinamibacterales bacterium]
MAGQLLELPVNIPWKQIAVSPDMIDTQVGNKRFPFVWRSSMAISVFEPKLEDLAPELCDERVTYVKVSCTVTGYQPSKEEILAGHASFPDVPTDSLNQILEEYFACYGVLLQVALFPLAGDHPRPGLHPIERADYPRIIALEPKVRDFYQAATESGEILTASDSGVKTDKSLTTIENTQTGFKMGAKVPVKGAELTGEFSHARSETNQDTWTVQTDASRERRETAGTTTQLNQMYNLLTGYHQGTNRAAFLMLPRPHILQPTDRRTFVQGLRVIEGLQEFLLIVSRPSKIAGLCIEATLDTGHFPEDVDVEHPPDEFEEGQEDFTVRAFADNGWFSGSCTDIESDPSSAYTIEAGWVIDRSKGDPGHSGVQELANNSNEQANQSLERYDYRAISDAGVRVSGRICGENAQQDKARFNRTYRVFKRREQPRDTSSEPVVTTPFLITSRSLLVCMRSGEICPEVVAPPIVLEDATVLAESVVDERPLRLRPALLTRLAVAGDRAPAIKDVLRQLQQGMLTSWRSLRRYPAGAVGFLESDYFKDKIAGAGPGGRLERSVAEIPDLPPAVLERLGRPTLVKEVLSLKLPELAQRTGLDIAEAAGVRRRLLGLPPPPRRGGRGESKGY